MYAALQGVLFPYLEALELAQRSDLRKPKGSERTVGVGCGVPRDRLRCDGSWEDGAEWTEKIGESTHTGTSGEVPSTTRR